MHPTDLEGRDRQQVAANLNSFRTSKGRDIVHSKRTIDQDSVSKKKHRSRLCQVVPEFLTGK
jgi:hypothetical protein